MPNRILKESVCTSDSVDSLSWFEECFFYRLIVNCDDYGRMDARPAILKARLFPLKDITHKNIADALQSLRAAGLVELYEVDAHPYLQLCTWDRHQQVRAKKGKFPAPDGNYGRMQPVDRTCNHLIADDCKCSRNPIQSESYSESEYGCDMRRCGRVARSPRSRKNAQGRTTPVWRIQERFAV